MGHRLIGEILKDICGLSNESIEDALRIQEEKGDRIGDILIRKKAIS